MSNEDFAYECPICHSSSITNGRVACGCFATPTPGGHLTVICRECHEETMVRCLTSEALTVAHEDNLFRALERDMSAAMA